MNIRYYDMVVAKEVAHATKKLIWNSLIPDEKRELIGCATKYTLPYFDVLRAKMIFLAYQGLRNDEIAAELDTKCKIVSMWRKCFFEQRLKDLEERTRPGRARSFSQISPLD